LIPLLRLRAHKHLATCCVIGWPNHTLASGRTLPIAPVVNTEKHPASMLPFCRDDALSKHSRALAELMGIKLLGNSTAPNATSKATTNGQGAQSEHNSAVHHGEREGLPAVSIVASAHAFFAVLSDVVCNAH
jgi:hypothetical protein